MKTGKVTGIHGIRKWDGPHGTVYFHKIEFDNGDQGDIGKKTENAIKIGDSIDYTLETTDHGNRIKQVQSNGFGGGKSRGSDASFALSYAKDVVCAGSNKLSTIKEMTEATIMVANRFHAWLKENQ